MRGKRISISDVWRPLLLLTLVAVGLALHFLELIEWRQLLQWADEYSQYWWVVAGLILLQALLFMLALPGSTLLWVVAPLYPPVSATLILVAGSTLGGAAGYIFARTLAAPWLAQIRGNRFFHLLEKRSDFLIQCAIRILPTFPHCVINYSAGLLKLPLRPFLSAAVIGISIKTFLYTTTIYRAVNMTDPSELIRIETMAPLVILALLFILALFFQHRLSRMHRKA